MEKSTFSPSYAAIRRKLVAVRNAAGLTQRKLAEKLGREPSFVARIEQGERRLDVLEFYWVMNACGVNAAKVASDLLREIEKSEKSRSAHRRR